MFEDTTKTHYLHLQHHEGKLISTVECINHESCDAAFRVLEEDASSPFAEYSILFEHFRGKKALLVEGLINIETTEDNNYVQWSYTESSYVDSDAWVSNLQENPSADHALLGAIEESGLTLEVLCVRPESYCGEDCVMSLLNSTVEILETCLSETTFRSDYITIEYRSHVTPARDDAATEYDSDLTWEYWNERVGSAQFASENVL